MKFLQRLKSYKFWIAFSGALIIFLNSIGAIFNFQIDSNLINNLIMAFCGVLVVMGFVDKELPKQNDEDDNKDDSEGSNKDANKVDNKDANKVDNKDDSEGVNKDANNGDSKGDLKK